MVTSERQRQANRENAKTSTGPVSAAGKVMSSMNAFKHGVFANRVHAIARGPFLENPDELEAVIDRMVDQYGPRDAAERAAAERVVAVEIKLARLDHFEASALSGEGEHASVLRLEAAQYREDDHAYWLYELAAVLQGDERAKTDFPEWFVERLAKDLFGRRVAVAGLWELDRYPDTPAQRWVVVATLLHFACAKGAPRPPTPKRRQRSGLEQLLGTPGDEEYIESLVATETIGADRVAHARKWLDDRAKLAGLEAESFCLARKEEAARRSIDVVAKTIPLRHILERQYHLNLQVLLALKSRTTIAADDATIEIK